MADRTNSRLPREDEQPKGLDLDPVVVNVLNDLSEDRRQLMPELLIALNVLDLVGAFKQLDDLQIVLIRPALLAALELQPNLPQSGDDEGHERDGEAEQAGVPA